MRAITFSERERIVKGIRVLTFISFETVWIKNRTFFYQDPKLILGVFKTYFSQILVVQIIFLLSHFFSLAW